VIVLLLAMVLLLAGGLAAWLAGRPGGLAQTTARTRASLLGAAGAVAGGGLAATYALVVLFGGASEHTMVSCGALGCLALSIDHLSALLLLPVCLVPALVAIFGAGTLVGRRAQPTERPGASWLAYDVLVACGALAIVARSTALLVVAWEGMALAASLLVGWAREAWPLWPGRSVPERNSAWHWLLEPQVAPLAQMAVAAQVAFFLLLGPEGPADFRSPPGAGVADEAAGLLFIVALIGFGATVVLATRAGPAASATPPHVPAVLPAVLIPAASYTLLTGTLMLGQPDPWWGPVAAGLGACAMVLGALGARRADDLGRLTAWTGGQHAAAILAASGLGLVALDARLPAVALLAFGAVLLHTLATALFLPLLALATGAIAQATHTHALARLGGLRRGMRDTLSAALAGGLAGAGLPPLNAVPGLLLALVAAILALASFQPLPALAGGVVVAGMAPALVLATAAWARALGDVFLGHPRSGEADSAREVALPLRVPMHLLTALCLAVAVFPPLVFLAAARPAIALAARAGVGLAGAVDLALLLLGWAGNIALMLLLVAVALTGFLWLRGRRRPHPVAAEDSSPGVGPGAP